MNHHRPRVALLGEGDQADRWACALRSFAQVCAPPEQPPGSIDALVVAPGARDPFAQTKEALLAGIPVLYAAPFLLSPWQATALDELSRHQRRLLLFVELFQFRPGFAFLCRLLEGEEPFWRPLYLRTLRLAPPDGPTRIDNLATEELAMCEVLLDSAPQQVTAATGRHNETGEVCAAFVTVRYADGPLAQCTVSLAEAASSSQLVIATSDRTVMLDEQDPVAPVRIIGGGQELSPESPALARSRQSPGPDPVALEAQRFLSAVAEGDLSAGNSARWARVAALWWAARESMSYGGPTEVPGPAFGAGYAEPPPLRVIQGGGRTAPTAWQRPPLTVVAR